MKWRVNTVDLSIYLCDNGGGGGAGGRGILGGESGPLRLTVAPQPEDFHTLLPALLAEAVNELCWLCWLLTNRLYGAKWNGKRFKIMPLKRHSRSQCTPFSGVFVKGHNTHVLFVCLFVNLESLEITGVHRIIARLQRNGVSRQCQAGGFKMTPVGWEAARTGRRKNKLKCFFFWFETDFSIVRFLKIFDLINS